MSQEPLDVALLPDRQFFQLMGEVEALPLRKRAKWHGFLRDTNGVKHRVHFINRQLVIKFQSSCVTVRPTSDQHLNDVGFDSPTVEEKNERLNTAYQRGGQDELLAEHNRMVHEAATGNHRSKSHKMRVPTKAGEPVRA